MARGRIDLRYWIPFLGYLEATMHNPLSPNFLENTLLYSALGLLIRWVTSPTFLAVTLAIFPASAVLEWVVFSRLKPRRFGWDRLDGKSFAWCVWQAFWFFVLGVLV